MKQTCQNIHRMKSIRYILISLVAGFIFFQNIYGCWTPVYTPGEYYVFRAYEKKEAPAKRNSSHLNILEWQQYTGNQARYEDINDVVYDFSVETMNQLLEDKSTDSIKKTQRYNNTFIKYLIDTNDKEAVRLLILAKECEAARSIRADKWWYPTKEELKSSDLQEILERALAYKGVKLKTRYLLQAIRAAFTMSEFELCLKLWEEIIQHQPESVVKTMCEDYIGGIYFQQNDFETAIRHYAKNIHNLVSFWWCADRLTKINSDVERIKILYRYCPDSPELARMIEKICREAEELANRRIFDKQNNGYKSYLDNRNRYIKLRDFALQVASEKRAKDVALWQYTAAFLTMIDGDIELANRYIQNAKSMKTTPFLQDNIRILQIMLNAFTGNYDASFETQMLNDLKWLDQKMVDNLTKKITEEYIRWEGGMFANYSKFYYNDMMRKITLTVMLPQYVKRGKEVKALLLAGMASERLRLLTNYRQSAKKNNTRHVRDISFYKGMDTTWNIDFYTDVFNVMDTIPVKTVLQYKQLLQEKNGNAFDRFLAERCHYNPDYLNEIIGTKYMRELKFDQAVKYLSLVKSGYENSLNIYEYFCYSPFADPFFGKKRIDITPGYKLSFATQMLDLQKITGIAQSNETKAEAMYRYAVGLAQATSDCWALFRYRNGSHYNYGDDKYQKWGALPKSTTTKYLDDAYNLSVNHELKAKCLAMKLWLNGGISYDYSYNEYTLSWEKKQKQKQKPNLYAQYSYILFEKYDKTNIYQQLMRGCDTFYSYIVSN